MGLTIPIALGVAIAQPQRHVIALSKAMARCSCSSAALRPCRARAEESYPLWCGTTAFYQITGSQPTASAASADLVAIARGAGISQSAWAADESEFDQLVASALQGRRADTDCGAHRR
jgi:hypothetical protein